MDGRQGMSKGTLIIGTLLIVVGIIFLVASLLGKNVIGLWWPLFIVAVGLLFFVPLFLREGSWGAFAIPGSVLTMAGVVLLLQNLFSAWQTWSYAWALVAPFAVGVGLYLFGVHAAEPGLRKAGGVVMKVGLVLFLVFGFFFEGLVGVSGSLSLRVVWPILLILVGLWIMVRPAFRRTARAPQVTPAGSGPSNASGAPWSTPPTPPVSPPAAPLEQWEAPAQPAAPTAWAPGAMAEAGVPFTTEAAAAAQPLVPTEAEAPADVTALAEDGKRDEPPMGA